jgi:NADPH2:quinone reductase
VLPSALAAPLPAAASYESGACLGIPAMTAYHAVAVAGVGKGSTVLITGGAGGVGHYAIQFAKARGATVLTTVSSDAKAALARQAGADHTIDYKRENVGDRVMALTGKTGVDAVVEMDLAANAKFYSGWLRPARPRCGLWNRQRRGSYPGAAVAGQRHEDRIHLRL